MAAMGRLPLLTTALGDRLVLPTKRLFKGCEIQRHDLLESASHPKLLSIAGVDPKRN